MHTFIAAQGLITALPASMPAAVDTSNATTWITGNVVQLLIIVAAVVALLAASQADNAKIIRLVAGIAMALGILALGTGNNAASVGTWLLGLVLH